jgi:hypothetical protein
MQRSAQLMSFFLPGHEMQEAQNKLQAFRLFAYVDQELRFPEDRPLPLGALVRRAMALDHHRRIFALEGVAHYHTAAETRKGPVSGLLQSPDLPECAMVSMHAGMGTCLAAGTLSKLGDNPSKAGLREAMLRFLELCHANSRAGWCENAIEPLGLSARTLHPHLVARIGDAIGEIDSQMGHNAQRLFWHGVGRSLYFIPTNFVTVGGAHERALRAAIAEAPTLEDRRNAVAGLVWAVTLVNVRHTVVMRNLLRAAGTIRMPGAVKNGIASALMVWKHMVPEDVDFLPAYSRAAPGSSPDARLWNDFVVAASDHAFTEVFPSLLKQGRVATVFQYREAS